MRPEQLRELSPTARALYWFLAFIAVTRGETEMTIRGISAESGIPSKSLYEAARQLPVEVTGGSTRIRFERIHQ